MFGLFGCGKKNGDKPVSEEPKNYIEINIENQITETDIWVIPDTDKNRKTSLWGTATLAKIKTGEIKSAKVEESENGDLYLIRMIDVDQMYYEANAVSIEKNQSILIRKGEGIRDILVEVYNENGEKIGEYSMFSARL